MYGICAYIYHKSKPNVGVYYIYICIHVYLYTRHEAYMVYAHANSAGYLPLCTDLGNLSRLCQCSSKSGGPPRSTRQKDSIFEVIRLGKIETKIKVHSIHGTGIFTFIYPKNQPSEGIYTIHIRFRTFDLDISAGTWKAFIPRKLQLIYWSPRLDLWHKWSTESTWIIEHFEAPCSLYVRKTCWKSSSMPVQVRWYCFTTVGWPKSCIIWDASDSSIRFAGCKDSVKVGT